MSKVDAHWELIEAIKTLRDEIAPNKTLRDEIAPNTLHQW